MFLSWDGHQPFLGLYRGKWVDWRGYSLLSVCIGENEKVDKTTLSYPQCQTPQKEILAQDDTHFLSLGIADSRNVRINCTVSCAGYSGGTELKSERPQA